MAAMGARLRRAERMERPETNGAPRRNDLPARKRPCPHGQEIPRRARAMVSPQENAAPEALISYPAFDRRRAGARPVVGIADRVHERAFQEALVALPRGSLPLHAPRCAL